MLMNLIFEEQNGSCWYMGVNGLTHSPLKLDVFSDYVNYILICSEESKTLQVVTLMNVSVVSCFS